MFKWLKISQHHHSGHLRTHEHTSYFLLGVVLVITGFPLTAFTAYAESPSPESRSISLTGIMPGKAPTVAATIDIPFNNTHFNTSPVKVSGTCPEGTLVELFKSDIFAGSTPCNTDGTYNLEIDLLIGQNTLIARVYDALNQPGPDSNSVTVYYDALPTQSGPIQSLDFGGAQLLLTTDAVFRGIFPDQELNIPITIIGGTAPYAVSVQWGDSSNKAILRNDNSTFITGHKYSKAGVYQISIQVTDSTGRVAFITVASIVNGQPPISTATISNSNTVAGNLMILWPLYIGMIAVVISFWIGEQREKHILRVRGLLLPS